VPRELFARAAGRESCSWKVSVGGVARRVAGCALSGTAGAEMASASPAGSGRGNARTVLAGAVGMREWL
jgi:hypothetical protein